MSAVEGRRRMAVQAYMSIEAAVAAATRVTITAEVIAAFKRFGHPLPLEPNIVPALAAAFRAAGFEVVDAHPVPDDGPCRPMPDGGWHCVPWKPCVRADGCLLDPS